MQVVCAEYATWRKQFSEYSRGRWYFNVAVQVQNKPSSGTAAARIDLGMSELGCGLCRSWRKIIALTKNPRWFRKIENSADKNHVG